MSGEDSSGVRVFPPVIYLAGLAAGFAIQWTLPVRIVPPALRPAGRVAGWLLVAAGVSLSLAAVSAFRRLGTSPNPTRPTTALAWTGPYRFTRNPMYVGLALMSAGVAGIANALWPLVLLPLVLAGVRRLVIDREERYLDAKFGEDYRRYRQRVRRWL